ncbi:MAG: response regulator [Myxococcales bacterium]|nr:response regulator [Myxococcales bacterium]
MTTLLIVEDDNHFRGALARELESHGFTVHTAASAEAAAQLLAREAIDVLLTDLRLGGQDGIDLMRRLPSLSRRTRAVLMSAYASARDHQIATELGAVTVLVKPFTASELLATIQKAIDCETGFQGSIHGLSLIDMAQMFHLAQRSITLHVGPPGETPSVILFERGEIVHAEHGHLRGTPALRAALATPTGTIRTSALPEDAPHTIDTAFGHLLLESLSQIDEQLHEAQRDFGHGGFEFLDDDAPPAPVVPVIDSTFATDTLFAGLDDELAIRLAPTPPKPDPTTDSIYAAWQPTRLDPAPAPAPVPAPAPAPPPALLPDVADACRDVVAAIEASVVCAVVDLEHGHLLGYHQHPSLPPQTDRTVATAVHALFAGPVLGRLATLGARGETATHQEVQLTSQQHFFFARALADGKLAVALITRKTINVGLGWALLRSNLGKLEPLLRG